MAENKSLDLSIPPPQRVSRREVLRKTLAVGLATAAGYVARGILSPSSGIPRTSPDSISTVEVKTAPVTPTKPLIPELGFPIDDSEHVLTKKEILGMGGVSVRQVVDQSEGLVVNDYGDLRKESLGKAMLTEYTTPSGTLVEADFPTEPLLKEFIEDFNGVKVLFQQEGASDITDVGSRSYDPEEFSSLLKRSKPGMINIFLNNGGIENSNNLTGGRPLFSNVVDRNVTSLNSETKMGGRYKVTLFFIETPVVRLERGSDGNAVLRSAPRVKTKQALILHSIK